MMFISSSCHTNNHGNSEIIIYTRSPSDREQKGVSVFNYSVRKLLRIEDIFHCNLCYFYENQNISKTKE